MIDGYVEKVLSGNTDAFNFIVTELKDDAYSLAISIVKDEFEAQEVVQKAFVKAYLKLDTFKANSSFSTWFHRILVNEAFYKKRKQRKESEFIKSISEEASTEKINNTLSKLEEEFQRYYINKALIELPVNHSLVMKLFYLKEYKIDEISEITGWSDSNIKVMLHRARKKMKQILSDLSNVDKEELY